MTTTARLDQVCYESDGEGVPVLMIHGLGGTSNTWSAMLASAGWAGYRLIRIDLPGSGRSALATPSLTIADHVATVRRIAVATGIGRAHVIGHSMGCIIAQHLVAAEPGFALSLALFGPLLALPDAARAVITARGERARGEGQAGMQAITDLLLETAVSGRTRRERRAAHAFVRESLMRQSPAGYAANCDALAAASPAAVERITCPVVLVTGDEDRVAPPEAVRAMAAHFDRATGVRVVVLPGCAHWQPIEQPEECERLAVDLLRRADRLDQDRRRRETLASQAAATAAPGGLTARAVLRQTVRPNDRQTG